VNFLKRLNRTHLATAVGVALAAGAGLLLHEFRFGRGLANLSYDVLQIWRGEVRATETAVVYLDENSFLRLGQPLNAPWDRSLHARLIDRLTRAGARAIVMDITFTDPLADNPTGDQTLAAAIKKSGRVILAADTFRTGTKTKQTKPPFRLLVDSGADIGSDELTPDGDLVVRKHTTREDNPIASLSWVAAAFVGATATQQPGAEDTARWMNYYGPPNSIPWTTYFEALDPSAVPDEFFRNKTVFVGARIMTKFAGERKDEYRNPYSSWMSQKMKEEQQASFIAGVEVQATAFLNLLRSDWLARPSWVMERLAIIGLGMLFGYGLLRFHPVWATTLAIGGLALVGVFSYFILLRKLIWFPWLIVAVQIGVALFWSILYNSVQLYVEKRLYEHTLRLYLPPKLVKKFAKSRELLKPGAQKQMLTLFFSDIANFTSISEGMDSDELAAMMNNYFQTAVSKCIHKADGTVAKYIGDAIFAFWNAPDEQAEHALRACEAALWFREQSAQPIHGRVLRTRIGLHTGVANVGNFGSEDRVDYTALGDSVNLASRLEGLNKHLGTDCLMSGDTEARIAGRLVTRALGSFQLKGFVGLVKVHELVGWPDQEETTRAWREAFAEALNNYEQRNLEFAQPGFRRVLELRPDDGPSKFYLGRIADLAAQALPENWATHTILKEK